MQRSRLRTHPTDGDTPGYVGERRESQRVNSSGENDHVTRTSRSEDPLKVTTRLNVVKCTGCKRICHYRVP